MARTLTYQQLLENLKNIGGFDALNADQTVSVSINGSITLNLAPYQEAVLKLDFKDFTDEAFTLGNSISSTASDPPIEELFGIDKTKTNIYRPEANGGSIIHNADRIIINAKDDFAMMFGKKGVVIASPGRVNIDAGKSITLFSKESVFFGLPNRGEAVKDNKGQKQLGTTKGDPTPDFLYEPIVLGIKLANLLDDIIFAVQNADMASAISEAKWQPSTIAEMELLRNRIPEMLSTYAYIDGISHELVDLDQLNKLASAQKKYKKSIPPKELTASVTAEISPPLETLGLGGDASTGGGSEAPAGGGGPIGQNTAGGGKDGAVVTQSDKDFAAKYNGGVMPVKINADGTIPVVSRSGGPYFPDSKPPCTGGSKTARPCSRTFYEVNPSYVKAMPKVEFYTQKGKKSTQVHPDFAAKLGPALAEVKSVGGDQYINDLSGGVIARNVTGGTRISHHGWGLAIDINTGGGKYTGALAGTSAADWGWGTNWNLQAQTVNGKPWNSAHRGFYEKVGKILMKHGIGWYYSKDAMHFSIYEGTPTS